MATELSHDSHAGAPGNLLVAIIDDDPTRAARTAAAASEFGVQTVHWSDASEIASQVARRRPALLLSVAGALGDASLHAAEQAEEEPLVVLLHGPAEIPTVVSAMHRGAFDYLAGPVDPKDLRARLRAAIETARLHWEALRRQAEAAERVARLGRRMRLLAEEIMLGRSSAEIARRWGVSERTIAGHRASLMRAMDAQNTAELVRMLVEGGFSPRADNDDAETTTRTIS